MLKLMKYCRIFYIWTRGTEVCKHTPHMNISHICIPFLYPVSKFPFDLFLQNYSLQCKQLSHLWHTISLVINMTLRVNLGQFTYGLIILQPFLFSKSHICCWETHTLCFLSSYDTLSNDNAYPFQRVSDTNEFLG